MIVSGAAPLRVLSIEDSADDAALIERLLAGAGLPARIDRVDTLRAVRAALERGTWDIILADYRFPEFTGIEAIALVRSSNVAAPIVVVSGTIGEDAAVAAMRAGADDYVLKSQLHRLPDRIRQQLAEAERRNDWRSTEAARRFAGEQLSLDRRKLCDALAMLSRGALYVAERLEANPPLDERSELLLSLRESASAAAQLVTEVTSAAGSDTAR